MYMYVCVCVRTYKWNVHFLDVDVLLHMQL